MTATEGADIRSGHSMAEEPFHLLVATAHELAARYPDDAGAFVKLAKLTEETGEVANQINIWAGTGLKREKHGAFDARELAAELSDVLRAVIGIALDLDILDLLTAEIRRRHTEIVKLTNAP
jgi:NTP pyrophosphatase (non-canonical NTP hydrolase)